MRSIPQTTTYGAQVSRAARSNIGPYCWIAGNIRSGNSELLTPSKGDIQSVDNFLCCFTTCCVLRTLPAHPERIIEDVREYRLPLEKDLAVGNQGWSITGSDTQSIATQKR